MKTIITNYYCDIHGCACEAKHLDKQIQVIFKTNQTDGSRCAPYLDIQLLDLCDYHMNSILEGRYISAYGAQGVNRYHAQGESVPFTIESV